MGGTRGQLWKELFRLAPIKTPPPKATLYEAIADLQDPELIQAYIDGGHDITQRFRGGSPLSLAVSAGNPELVRFVVEAGAPVHERTQMHDPVWDAAHLIAESTDEVLENGFAILDYLLTLSFNKPDLIQGFMVCTTWKQYTAAYRVARAGLNPDDEVRYDFGCTRSLEEHLLAHGAEDFIPILAGEPPTEEMLQVERQERLDHAREMAQNRDMMNSLVPNYTKYLLEGAAREEKQAQLVEQIRAGEWDGCLDAEERRTGRLPLEFAAANDLRDLVELFLPATTDGVDRIDAAKAAATRGRVDSLELIRAAETNPDNYQKLVDSALLCAACYGHLVCVEILLAHGANPRSTDSNGDSAAFLAGGVARSRIMERLRAAAEGSPPAFRGGYAVKGKPTDWSRKRKEAVEAGFDQGMYAGCWVRLDAERLGVLRPFAGAIADLRKTPLPIADGVFYYQLTDSEWTCLLPIVDRDYLVFHYPERIRAFAEQLSGELETDACVLFLEDASGTEEVHIWNGGRHRQSEDDAVDRLDELGIPMLKHELEDNGFERCLTIRNIKKSQVQRAGFLPIGTLDSGEG
ncbi:hypothetical protein CF392_11810 [Tamilnaduibacter salinus]|uniref:Ankyrin repeat protein n=1 Tax=Tamilnaduibacter salinus TaxID=1484056 RepID=A0A2A2I0Z7_9GAMM|nr:ankyrin repeat domain-containing protein [Tamilnaduibacter salinus]PAV25282.1 hypothetical protein CF392_11810 [Tamilnaduibacter salinus]